jgi:hypothetical protein
MATKGLPQTDTGALQVRKLAVEAGRVRILMANRPPHLYRTFGDVQIPPEELGSGPLTQGGEGLYEWNYLAGVRLFTPQVIVNV